MNFANVPEWAWILLGLGVLLVLSRHGWFDNLLNKPTPAGSPAGPPAPPQVITLKHVVEVQGAAAAQATDVTGGESQPVIERLSVKGPLKINVARGKIDVTP
jgi:hypothetical protein